MQIYSLFELNEYIRRILALNLPDSVWIECEIAQVGESRGHYFLSLIQKDGDQIIAQMEAVLWQQQYRRLRRQLGLSIRALLQAGISVRLKAKVDFHERYGLKLTVEEIDPAHTIGQLEMQKRANLQKLQELGLLKLNQQQRLPLVLQRIAIISSKNAAGLQDFLNQMVSNPYHYHFHMQLFPAAMQGEQVEIEVRKQLKKIEAAKESYDCIVLIRGGGAKLDLLAFDQYELCAAIAQFPLPVLTGIGHETDESILDKVAHTSLKTPTAVAEFIINHNLHFESNLMQLGYQFQQIAMHLLRITSLQLQQKEQQLQLLPQQFIQQQQQQLSMLKQKLKSQVQLQLSNKQQKLEAMQHQIEYLSIDNTLKRGFSLLMKDKKAIRSIHELSPNDEIANQLIDGTITSKVSK